MVLGKLLDLSESVFLSVKWGSMFNEGKELAQGREAHSIGILSSFFWGAGGSSHESCG